MKKSEEIQLRDEWMKQAKECKSLEDFNALFSKLVEHEHDYGTVCRAMAAVIIAAGTAFDRSEAGGITGFQASCVMWDFISYWIDCGEEKPRRLVDYSDLLYPQYADRFTSISRDTAEWIKGQAASNLASNENAHPNVIAHWESIAEGNIPFGLRVID